MTIRLSAGHPVYREQWIETSRSSMPTQSGIPPHLHDQRQANRKTVRMDENYSADCARPVLPPRSGSLVLGAPNNYLHLQAAGGTFSNSLLENCSITDASTLGTPAFAADMAVKAPRPLPAPAPVYSWTGFYVGGNVGYAWSRASMDSSIFAPNCTGPACPALLMAMANSQSMTSNGFTGGFQAGANYQTGPWVIGIEADIESFRLRNSFAFGPIRLIPPPAPGSPITLTSSGSVDTNWLATERPRVGVAFANFLVYATGGVAFTKQNNTLN